MSRLPRSPHITLPSCQALSSISDLYSTGGFEKTFRFTGVKNARLMSNRRAGRHSKLARASINLLVIDGGVGQYNSSLLQCTFLPKCLQHNRWHNLSFLTVCAHVGVKLT